MVHFVKWAVPGDTVEAQIQRKKNNYIESNLVSVLKPSEYRIDPKCKYFSDCGGCSWQNLIYTEQLNWKKKHINDAFTRLAHLEIPILHDTLESPKVFNYRNKMEFSFSPLRWLTKSEINTDEIIENKHFALGLHVSGRYDKIIDIDQCHIHAEIGNEILRAVKQKAIELDVEPFHQTKYHGFLKNLIIRTTCYNDGLMIVLLTKKPYNQNCTDFMHWIQNDFPKMFPQIDSLVCAENDTTNPTAIGEITFTYGNEFIYEDILGIKYRISPFSFFQTNSFQLERFISKIVEMAHLTTDMIVWDLYCGTGSITLPVARLVNQVYGLELAASSVADAKLNAEINEINNVKFNACDLHKKQIPNDLLALPQPDLVIVDPPRAGMHKNVVNHILASGAKAIVYVSCNPATQARDCELLSESYRLTEIQPVDMFPHTFHIESIARLELRN